MHTKPDLRVFLKWMIAGSGSVITGVILLGSIMAKSETHLITPDSIATAAPADHPQKLNTTYHRTHSNLLCDNASGREFFEAYSHVLISEQHGTITRELVDPVTRDGRTEFYGRVKLRENVPRFSDLEKFEKFHQFLTLLANFETLDSNGNIAAGVDATKSWSGFTIESGSFRVLWVTLGVTIQACDDEWIIFDRNVIELIYSPK